MLGAFVYNVVLLSKCSDILMAISLKLKGTVIMYRLRMC
nr:MAG TPA: hypothetical protein [Caudoviricetes sp.]